MDSSQLAAASSHHQSIMTGHGKVRLDGADRDFDFYRQLPHGDQNREDPFHKSHNLFQMGPSGNQRIMSAEWSVTDHIALALSLEWQSRDMQSEGGAPLVIERGGTTFRSAARSP